MMLLLVAHLLGINRPRRGEERTWHIPTDVDPEVARVVRARGAEVCRVGHASRRRGAVGSEPGELHAGAAVLVEHPELPGSRRDEILAVGGPDGGREVDPLALRDDVRPGAVGAGDPDILRAVAVTH